MRSAFVSHSTSDDSYAAEMVAFLHAAGYDKVFNDDSAIRPDEKFWPAIEKGIADCDTLVVVVTTASMDSEWVKREVEYARSLSKDIIPLRIENCSIPSIFDGRRVIELRPRTRQERRFDITRIVKYAPAELIGREDETKLLNDAWQKILRIEKGRAHVLTFVALGGEGKTSLVAKWAVELAHQDWPGCDAAFAWSFYSQGTREQVAASSDLFLKEALTFFGDDADKAFAASSAGAFEKGQRLARIVSQQRSLVILDGLEPLQYAPTSPTPGQLKDQGIAALLKGLAAASHGLCVVTTRYSLPDLRAFWQTTAPEVKLLRLCRAAGVHLLQSFGVKGSLLRNIQFHDGREQVNEFEKLVEDVKGHALTLNLLGTYLRDAHAGDIRRRDLVKLEEADAEEQGGHAFRVMEAYEREFEREGDKGQRALAALRLLGLFDRPLASDCLRALLQAPAIPKLTQPLLHLTEAQQYLTFCRLEGARLLTVNSDASGALISLDAHPLLREYFAQQQRTQQPDAWRAAHRRLYEHLCATTPDKPQPTLGDLQLLYQAVAHGCHAGSLQEALYTLQMRIKRGDQRYTTRKLGAFGSDLGAITCFFEIPWSRVSSILNGADQGLLYNAAAVCLWGLGRLTEALNPMRAGVKMGVQHGAWKDAALRACNLSELQLTLGRVVGAMGDSEQSVTYADRSGDMGERIINRATHADALHQAGRRGEARARFHEAEQMYAMYQVDHALLYSPRGFQYRDLLMAETEQAAWRKMQNLEARGQKSELITTCHAVSERAAQTLKIVEDNCWLLDIALDHLTLGRAALYVAILETCRRQPEETQTSSAESQSLLSPSLTLQTARRELDVAVDALRRAGQQDYIPRGLLTRAWLRFLTGARTGPDSAQEDLDEAWEIAERGPMRLFLADIHLHRARLFFREAQYPWKSPRADLAAAEKLINDCGYHRRDEELADAKAVLAAT